MYGEEAVYGILGLGPLSPIWYTLADPDTNQAVYSIALARLTPDTVMGASASSSNITLGGAADTTYYQDKISANITAASENGVSYGLTNLQFGIVYTDAGSDTSEYF
jgi:hypothetical protein